MGHPTTTIWLEDQKKEYVVARGKNNEAKAESVLAFLIRANYFDEAVNLEREYNSCEDCHGAGKVLEAVTDNDGASVDEVLRDCHCNKSMAYG